MNKGEILIYENTAGNIKIDVRLQEETVWLNQEQMGLLFGKAKSTINEHIQNIYTEGELQKEGTLQKFGNPEFQQKLHNYYNLDSVGAMVREAEHAEKTLYIKWQLLKKKSMKVYIG